LNARVSRALAASKAVAFVEACKLHHAGTEAAMAQKHSRMRKEEDDGPFVTPDRDAIRAPDECAVAQNHEVDDLEDHDGPETDDDRAGVL